jgi:hypothetical protein
LIIKNFFGGLRWIDSTQVYALAIFELRRDAAPKMDIPKKQTNSVIYDECDFGDQDRTRNGPALLAIFDLLKRDWSALERKGKEADLGASPSRGPTFRCTSA